MSKLGMGAGGGGEIGQNLATALWRLVEGSAWLQFSRGAFAYPPTLVVADTVDTQASSREDLGLATCCLLLAAC